jgi:hypothetical protein
MGATELRAHVAAHGVALSALGIELALAEGDARRVLRWGERHRAQALRARPVRPPQDPELATALATLRGVIADAEDAVLAGDDDPRLRARQVELERTVSRLTRRSAGGTDVRATARSRGSSFELGDAILLELVNAGPQLSAVVVDRNRATLHHLGPVDEVVRDAEALAFGLRRLARPGLPEASAATARATIETTASRLELRLLAPLAGRSDRPVVLVPTGDLHGLPWSALPSFREGRFTIVPSLAVWNEARRLADRDASPTGRTCAIAGPGLEAADREVQAVAAAHPGTVVLTSTGSTVDAVVSALDGAPLAHVAAHGRFRADNPLFSSLLVADGPLFVHDLERLVRAPTTVVLSACDAARSGRPAGEELLGLLGALFSLGTSAVVASVVPVPDVATAAFMTSFHAALAVGASVSDALREARRAGLGGDGPAFAAALAFTGYGDTLGR